MKPTRREFQAIAELVRFRAELTAEQSAEEATLLAEIEHAQRTLRDFYDRLLARPLTADERDALITDQIIDDLVCCTTGDGQDEDRCMGELVAMSDFELLDCVSQLIEGTDETR